MLADLMNVDMNFLWRAARTGHGERVIESTELAADSVIALPSSASLEQLQMSEIVLDLRGLWCPQPVLRAKNALRTLPLGGILVLECTDPMTEIDIPHFVKQTGQRLVDCERKGKLYVFRIARLR